nr:hypothetical transcript [Hymenolepis microstoma]
MQYCSPNFCCGDDHKFVKILLSLPIASFVVQLGYAIYILVADEHVANSAMHLGMLFGFGIFSLIIAVLGIIGFVKGNQLIIYLRSHQVMLMLSPDIQFICKQVFYSEYHKLGRNEAVEYVTNSGHHEEEK